MADSPDINIVEDGNDDQLEVPLIDLSRSLSLVPTTGVTADSSLLADEEQHARGPVDLYQATNDRRSHLIANPRAAAPPSRVDNELRLARLADGSIVRIGDTVELQLPPHRSVEDEASGDFLKILKIVKDDETGAVSIQGHRFMREKYVIGRSFVSPFSCSEDKNDRKGPRLNELVMHMVVQEDDDRPAFVQGLERIPITEVSCKRTIIVTEKPYPMLSFRDQPSSIYAHLAGKTTAEKRLHIFQNGPLVCRWTRISIISPNGNTYGGTYRYVSKKEAMASQRPQQPEASRSATPVASSPRHHTRTISLEEVTVPWARKSSLPQKTEPYTMLDMFCGGGGASRGGDDAGLKVVGGLDHNATAMEAWEQNNSGAIPLCMDSFAFLEDENHRIIGRVVFLNISNPCQTFSGAQ